MQYLSNQSLSRPVIKKAWASFSIELLTHNQRKLRYWE